MHPSPSAAAPFEGVLLYKFQENGIAVYPISQRFPVPKVSGDLGQVVVSDAGDGVAAVVVAVTSPEDFQVGFGQTIQRPEKATRLIAMVTLSRYDARGRLVSGVCLLLHICIHVHTQKDARSATVVQARPGLCVKMKESSGVSKRGK